MTSISFHSTYGTGNKLNVTVEQVISTSGRNWFEIRVLEGTREVGEITVYDAGKVEIQEPQTA